MKNETPLKYFEHRTNFELKIKKFFDLIKFVVDKDYDFIGHMFIFYNYDSIYVLSYDLDMDNETDMFSLSKNQNEDIVFNNIEELITSISKLNIIKVALRNHKLKRILDNE